MRLDKSKTTPGRAASGRTALVLVFAWVPVAVSLLAWVPSYDGLYSTMRWRSIPPDALMSVEGGIGFVNAKPEELTPWAQAASGPIEVNPDVQLPAFPVFEHNSVEVWRRLGFAKVEGYLVRREEGPI